MRGRWTNELRGMFHGTFDLVGHGRLFMHSEGVCINIFSALGWEV